jgi:hypothetical protein
LGLPVVLVLGSFFFFRGYYRSGQADEFFSAARRQLEIVRREGVDSSFIQKRLNLMYGMLSEEIITPESIQLFLDRVKAEGLSFANFRFFDEKGQHIPLKGESETYRVFIRKIFSALIQPEVEGKASLLSQHSSFFESFLGKIKPATLVNEKSSLIRVSLNGKPGWFYWNAFFSHLEGDRFKGGMIVFFEDAAIPVDFGLRKLIAEENRRRPLGETSVAALVNLQNHQRDFFSSGFLSLVGLSHDGLREKIVKMRKELAYEDELARGFLLALPVDAEKSLLYFRSSLPSNLDKVLFLLGMLFLVAVVALFRALFQFFAGGHLPQWGIQQKLKFVIGASISLPMLGMMVIALLLANLHQRSAVREISDRLTSFINAVDEKYIDAVKELERNYLVFAADLEKNGRDGKILAMASSFHDDDKFRQVFLLGSKGQIKFSYPQTSSFSGLLAKFLPALGQKLFAGRSQGSGSWRNRVNDMMFDAMTENLGELLGDSESRANFMKIFEKRDQIVEFRLANQRFYIFTHFLETGRFEKNPELLIIWHDAGSFAGRYLKQQVQKYQNEGASPIRLAMRPRRVDQPPYPGELAKYPFAVNMFEKVVATENQQFAVAPKDGENWLIVASPMKRASGFVLFAMQSMHGLESEVFFAKILLMMLVLASALTAWRIFVIAGKIP